MAKPTTQNSPKSSESPLSQRSQARVKISTVEILGLALLLLFPLAPIAVQFDQLRQYLPSRLRNLLAPALLRGKASHGGVGENATFSHDTILDRCEKHTYTSKIVSLDPLVIYINNFTSLEEAEELIKLGEPDFEASYISRSHGGNQLVSGRTSQSAPLPMSSPLVQCLLTRARSFMGSMLLPHEPFSTPQLVRYYDTQRYDFHTDFWPQHQVLKDGSGRLYNRVASFFVFMRDNCTKGETFFPAVDVFDDGAAGLRDMWKGRAEIGDVEGKRQGVKFRPITGNAVFWVNLNEKGEGDRRVLHAGLPVGEGEKIGLNLWPRKFYGNVDEGRGQRKKSGWKMT